MTAAAPPGRLSAQFRLPPLRGNRAVVIALAVDSLGTGLFLPFLVLYFLHTTSLSLSTIGTALTLAGLLALPTPLVATSLVARWSAKSIVAAGDLAGAAAYLSLLWVHTELVLVAAALLANLGWHTYSTGVRALIGQVAAPGDRRIWFALQSMTRNVGYGLGGVVGAFVVSGHGAAGYHAAVVLDAVSYFVTAAILLIARPTHADPADGAKHAALPLARGAPPSVATTLRDRGLWAITLTNLVSVLCQSVLTVLLPVYIVETLHQPTYLAGLIFTTNTALVVVGQLSLTGITGRQAPRRVLRLAFSSWILSFGALWALSTSPPMMVLVGLFASITIWTLAEVLAGPTINAAIVDIAPENQAGRHLAFFQLSWSIGLALAPVILINLLTLSAAGPWVFLIALSLIPVATLGCRFDNRTEAHSAQSRRRLA